MLQEAMRQAEDKTHELTLHFVSDERRVWLTAAMPIIPETEDAGQLTLLGFLQAVGLSQYAKTLEEHGHPELNGLLRALTENVVRVPHLEAWGLRRGEARRLVTAAHAVKKRRELAEVSVDAPRLMVGDVVTIEARLGVVQSMVADSSCGAMVCVKTPDGAYVWVDADTLDLQEACLPSSMGSLSPPRVSPKTLPGAVSGGPLAPAMGSLSIGGPAAPLNGPAGVETFAIGSAVRVIESQTVGMVASVSAEASPMVCIQIDGGYVWHDMEALQLVSQNEAGPEDNSVSGSAGKAIQQGMTVFIINSNCRATVESLNGEMANIKLADGSGFAWVTVDSLAPAKWNAALMAYTT